MHSGEQSRRDRFHIAFDTAYLPSEKNLRMRFHLQSLKQQGGRVDVSVAMDLSVAQETRVLKTRNQAQDLSLFAELKVVLKSNEIVGIRAKIFLAKLHNGIGHFACAGISQSDGFHRPKTQRVAASARDLFDGQAAFKIVQLFPVAFFDRLGGRAAHRKTDRIRPASWGS